MVGSAEKYFHVMASECIKKIRSQFLWSDVIGKTETKTKKTGSRSLKAKGWLISGRAIYTMAQSKDFMHKGLQWWIHDMGIYLQL